VLRYYADCREKVDRKYTKYVNGFLKFNRYTDTSCEGIRYQPLTTHYAHCCIPAEVPCNFESENWTPHILLIILITQNLTKKNYECETPVE
jgi:hypothetical protein